MLVVLVSILVRLVVSCITLAIRIALALAALAGRVIGLLIVALWRAWRDRPSAKVPLRAEQVELGSPPSPEFLPPPPTSDFVARSVRPRPKR